MTTRHCDAEIPDSPRPPYPLVSGYCDITCGFGRGSAELGIPTANVPIEELSVEFNNLSLGIYFGFAKVQAIDKQLSVDSRSDGTKVEFNYGRYLSKEKDDLNVLPVVLSIGKNPFYGNNFKTIELHIIHKFNKDFYGAKVKFCILGYLRPELDYTTKEALIKDINIDIYKSLSVLSKDSYKSLGSLLDD
ncbi:hypothetical protein HG535_0F05060 [Zygotorulaspora mrakii]|uniref:Riboflavin kinase n=1 Tax=Zygotorulaspora mrakii TaxID=42260 RepID=A0A7H9B6P9_ZYGMR|nr:uncharacterized protein HG535_0F05060 [Zygotorulaspora mrakii]QLG73994.1 hypothetical protein HG535_0F05060 [Zygotorulaspora mrakii]